MMAISHVVAGGAVWGLVSAASGQPVEPASLALAALGALLPDIDHPGSWVGKRLILVSAPISAVLGHRGVTHSLLAVLGMSILLGLGGLGHAAAPLAAGYLSHLACDGLTPSGVPLLWPLKRTYALPLCKTGSAAEMAIVGLLGALAYSLMGDVANLGDAGRALRKLLKGL
jgi:inner membrane protein